MTEQVDTEARINADKALTVIFILAIIAVNVLLIFKFAYQGRFLLSQRRFIIVTLAGGDILVALFPLVVRAQGLFEKYFDCFNLNTSKVYLSWFFPFVYGVALVVLSLELINRKKIRKIISNPLLASVFLAAIPWISALVLMLPLGVAGFTSYTYSECYWDPVFTEDRMRACYIIGAIIPSILAVVVAWRTSSKNIDPEPEVLETTNPRIGTVISNPTYPVAQPTNPVAKPTVPVAQPTYPSASQSTVPKAALPVQHRPAQAEASISTAAATQNEQQTLVMVAIANAILILPRAFYFMCYDDRISESVRMDPVPEAVLTDLFTWLMYLRSVVVPLIWLRKNMTPA